MDEVSLLTVVSRETADPGMWMKRHRVPGMSRHAHLLSENRHRPAAPGAGDTCDRRRLSADRPACIIEIAVGGPHRGGQVANFALSRRMEGSNSCDMSPDASRPYAIDSQTAGLGRGPRSAGRRACRVSRETCPYGITVSMRMERASRAPTVFVDTTAQGMGASSGKAIRARSAGPPT